ncbi:hypothetical protein NDU88_002334 [Pleurodeles waltl]|uniref:Uncharacterized protein n=1 Tax=Pleurodeles waltl TaxID=8319 RepID=A0AAV7SF32_PLEWA|nr:hypothetical protein NDU88_002334 [Pleurodeles waltl]
MATKIHLSRALVWGNNTRVLPVAAWGETLHATLEVSPPLTAEEPEHGRADGHTCLDLCPPPVNDAADPASDGDYSRIGRASRDQASALVQGIPRWPQRYTFPEPSSGETTPESCRWLLGERRYTQR